jgi:ADP-ribose pyrophosphatase YjhB (NUDIX family)
MIRSEVVALHLSTNGWVGVQYPKKAALDRSFNLSTLQGGIEEGETGEQAIIRECLEEYHCKPVLTELLFTTQHTSRFNGRTMDVQVYMILTGGHIMPNQEVVASFAWCRTSRSLQYALYFMSPGKQMMLRQAATMLSQRHREYNNRVRLFSVLRGE